MAKTKVTGAPKDVSRNVKNGSINKKKHQKFKQTPTGKVALINGSQANKNGNSKPQKNGGNIQRSLSQKKSPKGGNKHSNTSLASSTGKKSPKAALIKTKEEPESCDEDDEDINEGISIKEEVSAPEDEADDSDSSIENSGDGSSVHAILGTSLADETDEDDDEFDAESADEENVENKGVKMFKGVKKEIKEDESSDDDEEEEEDDEEDDEGEKSNPGLAALLGASIADESDDEEFEAAEHDSDDDDDVSEEDDEDSEVDQSLNSSVMDSSNVGEDDDEDEDDDDEDEDDDDDDSSPDITALLGKSIADESDDEDFEGEEESEDDDDEDMSEDDEDTVASPGKKSKKTDDDGDDDGEDGLNESHDSTEFITADDKEPRLMTRAEKAERDKRTVYVGNVPKDTEKSTLKTMFKKYGTIDSIRIRGIIPENPKMPLKVAAITKKYHPKSNTVCCFVTYKSEDSATKALDMNGKKLDGNYLRVDRANKNKKTDKKKSVFLGNLPFTVEDNDIWEIFKTCGPIDSVRIIRDRKTGLGRGFGYINFQSADGAVLAMDLDGTSIQNRELRIQVNNPEAKKKKRAKRQNLKRSRSENAEDASPKKMRTDDSEAVETATRNSVNAERRTQKKKRSQGEKQRDRSDSTSSGGKADGKYQGQKADTKKKPKQNKFAKKKKQMAAKLLAKPKKPTAN